MLGISGYQALSQEVRAWAQSWLYPQFTVTFSHPLPLLEPQFLHLCSNGADRKAQIPSKTEVQGCSPAGLSFPAHTISLLIPFPFLQMEDLNSFSSGSWLFV